MFALLLALGLPACINAVASAVVSDTGFADVAADAWYAKAAAYCRDNSIISGITVTAFCFIILANCAPLLPAEKRQEGGAKTL